MTSQRRIKRTIDFVASSISLLVLSPLLLWIAWRVRKDVGSPVLFRQLRPGLHGEPFTMVKFRTMRDAVGPDGVQMPDGERLTDFGRFLRRTSLDELPELRNVLKGDMSLIGPRPLLMEYLSFYTPQQMRRHEMRPGITGWAQVNGRNKVDWERRFELDVYYVDRWSLWFDVKILMQTLVKIFRREGVVDPEDTEDTKFSKR